MAATIEGAFVLIDRASSTMEKMERQAMKTMAAIEGVGAAQDQQSKRGATAARAMSRNVQGMRDTETGAKRTRRAVDDLGRSHEQSARRVGVLQRALSGLRAEFSRLRGGPGDRQLSGFGAMERDLRRVRGALSAFMGAFGAIGGALSLFKFPALISGFAMLAQSVVALAGAAVGALPALAALASGMNAIPGAIGVALQGVVTLKAAFSGVMQAAQAGMQAQNQWSTNQRDWRQQVTQAQGAVADAVHGVSDAAFAQQQAVHSLSEAYYAHTQALQGLSNALYDQKQAQLDLTIARRDAIRTLQDMEFAANSAVLKEARAGLNIRQAQMELQQAMMTPGTSQLQIESDRLAVMEAQSAAAQTHTDAVRSRVDYSRAASGDRTAAPVRQVAQAQHALQQAHIGVAAAQHEVQQSAYGIVTAEHAVADAAYASARAQRSVGQAQFALNTLMRYGNSGVAAYRKQLMGLQPIQRQFVQFLVGRMGPGNKSSLIGQLQQLQQSAGQGLFPPLIRGVRELGGAFPMLNRNLQRSGSILGNLGAKLIDTFFGPKSLSQTDSIMKSNNVVMQHGATAVGYFADMTRRLMVAAGPFLQWLSKSVEEWARLHDQTMASAAGQEALRAKFERLKTVLTELHVVFRNVWAIFHNVNKAAWDFNQTLMHGAGNATAHWAAITGSAQGQKRMHDWFMGLLPLLRALGKLVEAVAKGLVTMTSPQANKGTASLVGGLTKLVPVIAKVALNLERIFGPAIVSALGSLGNALSVLTGNGGPFALWLKMLTGVIKALTWLMQLPVIGKGLVLFFATLFAANTLAKFAIGMTGAITKVLALAAAWRRVGRERRGGMGPGMASPGTTGGRGIFGGTGATGAYQESHMWGIRSMGGPGSVTNPLMVRQEGGGGFGGGGLPGSSTGGLGKDASKVGALERDLTRAESVGAKLAGIPLIGGVAKFLPGALGRGAGAAGAAAAAGSGVVKIAGAAGEVGMLGKFAAGAGKFLGPLGLALTALPAITSFIGTKGNFGERSSAAGAGLINSLTFGLTGLKGSPTTAQQRTQGTQRANVSFGHFNADPTTGLLTPQGITQYHNRLAELQRQIHDIQNPPAQRARAGMFGVPSIDTKKLTDRLSQVKQIEANFNKEQTAAGQAASLNWTDAFQHAVDSGRSPRRSMHAMISGLTMQMRDLNPMGRRALQNAVVAWGAQVAQSDPKMRRPIAALNKWIIGQFQGMGANVAIVNGQILTNANDQWQKIQKAMTDPANVALSQLNGTFGKIEALAVGSLESMGFSKTQAKTLFGNVVAKAQGATNINVTGMGAQHGGTFATGGRVYGNDTRDSYRFGDNMLGGGELVMNRHQEMDANARLMRHGEPTVGSIVSSRTTPHWLMGGVSSNSTRHWAHAAGGRGASGSQVNSATGAAGTTGGYIYPIGQGAVDARVDQGKDFTGGPFDVGAIGPGTVVRDTLWPGWPGTGGVVYRLTAGPKSGSMVYQMEHQIARVHTGQPVVPGQIVTTSQPGYPWLEIGWANSAGTGPLTPYNGSPDGTPMPGGKDFAAFIAGLAHGKLIGSTLSGGTSGAAGTVAASIKALKGPRIKGVGGIPYVLAQTASDTMAAAATKYVNDKLAKQGPPGTSTTAGSANFAGVKGTGGSASANQTLGHQMMLAAGWGESEWPSLLALWNQESGWSSTAVNPTSGAAGIPQALGHGNVFPLGQARPQIAWGLNYIRGRYGSPSAAEAHEKSFNWYAGGGRVANWAGWHRDGGTFRTNGPTVFGAGEGGVPETVTVRPDSVGSNNTRPIHIEIHKIEVHRKGDVKKVVDEELALLADALRGD